MTTPTAIEAGARAAAQINGDDFDKIPRDKPHWIAERGHFNGRFRDINEPFQSGYLEMSEEVIKAALATGSLVPASAVAEMRERCAKAAEDHSQPYALNTSTGPMMFRAVTEKIATAIRQLDLSPAGGEYVVVPRNSAHDLWAIESGGLLVSVWLSEENANGVLASYQRNKPNGSWTVVKLTAMLSAAMSTGSAG